MERAASWCGCLLNIFSVKGWIAKELRTMHVEEYMDLVDNLAYSYFDDEVREIELDDMVTFFSSSPKLSR